MITIFEPVYIYNLYHSLTVVFLYYGIIYLLYLFAVPLGGKASARYGFEHCIFYSIPFAILYFLTLSQLPGNVWLLPIAIILVIIYKSLFWPAYHADFAHYSKLGYKGRELSAMSLVSTVATILGPIVGGIVIMKFGFEVLFVIVSIISLISALPLFSTKEVFDPHNFSYKNAFRRIIKPYGKYERTDSVAFFGYGEELIVAVGWPIFIYMIIEKFYLMGILTSVMTLAIAFISLYVGRLSDILSPGDQKKLLSTSTLIYSISWLLSPFVGNWLGVLLIDIISKGSKAGIRYPLFTFVYTGGNDHKGYLKYSIFYEMSLAAGKTLFAFIAVILSLVVTGFAFWFIIFGLAALWSFSYIFSKV